MKLFTAVWCGPCHELEDIKNDPPDGLEIIDVDENMEEVEKHQIRAVPTLLKDDGTIVMGPKAIREELEKVKNENMEKEKVRGEKWLR